MVRAGPILPSRAPGVYLPSGIFGKSTASVIGFRPNSWERPNPERWRIYGAKLMVGGKGAFQVIMVFWVSFYGDWIGLGWIWNWIGLGFIRTVQFGGLRVQEESGEWWCQRGLFGEKMIRRGWDSNPRGETPME